MKIKVILKETIKGVGKKDEIVEVKDGYANKKNHDNDVRKANELKEQLNSKEIVLKVKAGNNGKVFGSVGGKEIAEAIKEQLNIDIDKKKVSTDARMKELGLHTVELKLHSEVKAIIKIKLEAQD